jgi:hypothetical protein
VNILMASDALLRKSDEALSQILALEKRTHVCCDVCR